MKHYDFEISLFIDGELENEKHNELFSHLAGCADCQKLLADSLVLKEKARVFCTENINEIKNKPKAVNKFYKYGFYASAAAAVLLIFLLASTKPKEVLVTKNEVRVDTVFVEKAINTNQIVAVNTITPGKKVVTAKNKKREAYLDYLFSLRSEKLTETDLVSVN